ncbi:MAG: 16S rRNA (cytidine(1402)-2'-O)-methyltransferase, partial [Eubacterium sp.]|nr:16S rRNA (cytidine(1402)-2'-O)-methyltransferase [Eubacterium sp.]
FTFEGFLSVNIKSRREHREEIKEEKRTLIFYEAPHKLANTLQDLHKVLGDRQLAIVREITKIHEQVIRTTLSDACEQYCNGSLKGEIVLIVEGKKAEQISDVTLDAAVNMAKQLVEKGMSVNNAAKEIASQTPFKKGDIYKALL